MRPAVDISAASNPEGSGVAVYVRFLVRHLAAASGGEDEFYFVSRPGRTGGLKRCGLYAGKNIRTGMLAFPFDLFFRGKIDLFHGTDARLPKYKLPLVATIFDLFSMVSAEYGDDKFRGKKIARYRDIAERSDVVIVPSESTRADVLRHLGVEAERVKKISLAPGLRFDSVAPDEIKKQARKFDIPDRYVLFAGDVSARKNTAKLVRAFGIARARADNKLSLVLAGKESYGSPAVRAEAEKLPPGAVKFTGYLPDDELAALYRGASVFAFPSLYEGFGMPVLEAFSAGVPVVASNRGSIPEVAGDAALLVDPESEEHIADAITRVITDETLRSTLIAKGGARAVKFSWEKCARETLAAYRTAIERFRERKGK
jgi:alpha-1,3-rhamnosyl/mannosyltransferase